MLNRKAALFVIATLLLHAAWAQTLVHYWNFNSLASGTLTSVSPDASLIPGATITYPGTGTGYMDNVNPGSSINARNSDAIGLGLRPRNPSNTRELRIAASTLGYQDIVISFATTRTNNGADQQLYEYSTDGGANFDTTGLSTTSSLPTTDPTYSQVTINLSSIAGVKNNPNFIFRIRFAGANAGGSSGNNRFDNVTIEGTPYVVPSELVHYWHFNNLPSGTLTTVSPDSSKVPSGTAITYPGTGAGFMDNVNPGSSVNARNGYAAGLGIRPRNPANTREFLIAANTTGYENIIINLATTKSSNGPTEQQYDYSIDGGANYVTTGLSPLTHNPTTEPAYSLVTFDLSAVAGVSNNASFIFRVKLAGSNNSGSSGNNRFDNITVEGTPMTAGPDVTAPQVTFNPANAATGIAVSVAPTITFNENIRLVNNTAIDNSNVDAIVELRLNNASGALVPFDATFAGNVIAITPSSALLNTQQYYVALLANTVEDVNDNAVTSVQSVSFTTAASATKISFATDFVTVNETAGTLNFNLNLVSPATSSVNLVVKGAPFSTADAGDFTLATQTLNFTAGSSTTQSISIPIINDANEEQAAEYFVLSLESPVGLSITGTTLATIYIKDNDRVAPVPTKDIELVHVGSFDPSGSNNSTCEIVVHDSASQRLFTTSAIAGFLDIIDFSNPAALSVITSVDMNVYGGVTSVAVKNGIVAVASPNANEQLNGSVVFFNTNGTFLKQVTVGALPDMITFTPDGNKVITANEGQPDLDYTVDPEGSVSIIDISGGIAGLTQSNVTTLLFTAYNAQETALRNAGVRKLKLSSTMSQDFEPEYVTITDDSKKAWVTLQENNAIAEIDLETLAYTGVWPLGTKNYSAVGSGYDASDNNGQVLIASWPVKAFYIPDGIAHYKAGSTNYFVTANEGDEKEYNTLNERTTVGASSYILDPAKFPNAEMLKKSHNLGRFRVTNLNGDTDNDGDIDTIYSVGSRSFTIWNADTRTRVYDSGDDFEMYTAATAPYSSIFNADHEDNVLKGRSRSKGPEPEGVALGKLSGKTYSFVSLERIGGVMVYDITDPNTVKFVDYNNTRSTTSYAGDHGAEGITFVKANSSPNGKAYVLVANEISGTITVYEVVNHNAVPNDCPTVSVTAPANGGSAMVGDAVTISATAADTDGTIAQVEFFVNGVSVGIDNTAPYSIAYTATLGTKNITAVATDNDTCNTTSATVTITVTQNAPPTVSITAPGTGTTVAEGTNIAISAVAADSDGSITQVEFFVDNVSVGVDNSSPYGAGWISVIGVHTLTAIATDNNGAITTSAPVSITVTSTNASYLVGSLSIPCDMSTFCVPVKTVTAVADVIGYDIVMNYDKNMVQPTGAITVRNSLVNPVYVSTASNIDPVNGLIYISLYFNTNAPVGTKFSGTGDLVCVEFVRTNNFGISDTTQFSISTLQESYANGIQQKLANLGAVTSSPNTSFSSSLRFWMNGSPLGYDGNGLTTLVTDIYGTDNNCANPSTIATQPDSLGRFTYNLDNGPSISIQRDIANTTSVQPVVNGFDAFLVRRVLINDITFIPSAYQMIAMDVNVDGVISAGDLSQINQRAVLIFGEFRQTWNYSPSGAPLGPPSKDWVFVNESALNTPAYQISSTYPFDDNSGYSKTRVPVTSFCQQVPVLSGSSVTCVTIDQETYTGVLLGDVNGNFSAVHSGGIFKKEANSKVTLDMAKATRTNGYMEIPVEINAEEDIHAVDLAIKFDESKLTYHASVSFASYMSLLDNFNTADRTLRITSSSLDNIEMNQPLFAVRFQLNAATISQFDFNSADAFLNGDKVNFEFKNAEVTGINEVDGGVSVSVFPNPATNFIGVRVSERATVQLMDISGKEVITQMNVNANHKQDINTENLAAGVYLLRVSNDNFTTTRRIVVSK